MRLTTDALATLRAAKDAEIEKLRMDMGRIVKELERREKWFTGQIDELRGTNEKLDGDMIRLRQENDDLRLENARIRREGEKLCAESVRMCAEHARERASQARELSSARSEVSALHVHLEDISTLLRTAPSSLGLTKSRCIADVKADITSLLSPSLSVDTQQALKEQQAKLNEAMRALKEKSPETPLEKLYCVDSKVLVPKNVSELVEWTTERVEATLRMMYLALPQEGARYGSVYFLWMLIVTQMRKVCLLLCSGSIPR